MRVGNRLIRVLSIFALIYGSVAIADAAAAQFHSEVATTTLNGTGTTLHVFETQGGEIKCSTTTYTATQSATTVSDLTFSPSFSGCSGFGGTVDATVPSTCKLTFTQPTSESAGPLDIACSSGAISFSYTFGGNTICTVTFGNQGPLSGGAKFINFGTGTAREIFAEPRTDKLTYTVDGGKGICGTEGTHTDGKYIGTVKIVGTSGGKQVGIWVG